MSESKAATTSPPKGLIPFFAAGLRTGRVVGHSREDAGLNEPVKKFALSHEGTVFYHYNTAGEEDQGWGCAYRAGMTVHTSLRAAYPDELAKMHVPTILEQQWHLRELGMFEDKDVGSHKWIEPPHVAAQIEAKYPVVKCRSDRFDSTPEAIAEFITLLWEHFQRGASCAMIDDAIKAYAVGGILETEDGATYMLMLDPHVVGNFQVEAFGKKEGAGAYWIEIAPFLTKSKNWMHITPLIEDAPDVAGDATTPAPAAPVAMLS